MTEPAPARPEPKRLLRGGRLLNLFTGELLTADILLGDGLILGVGGAYQDAREVYELDGRIVLPGFIDSHLHIESSLLTPSRFAEAVVPRGTTTVIADPHEIANVLGADGVRWMLRASEGLPLDCFFMAPSCVPASAIETSGARIDPAAIEDMLEWGRVLGLAEVMDVPGVIAGKPDILSKIRMARRKNRLVDGHAPRLTGHDLNAYLAAGIESDHECVSVEEAREKLRLGMWIMMREGSQAKNLSALLPLVDPVSVRRCVLVSDDRNALDLLNEGHMDHLLREAVARGLPPLWAVQMVALNPAEYFGLRRLGSVAPGRQADLVVVNDLKEFRCELVFKAGRLVAEGGKLLAELPPTPPLQRAMNAGPFSPHAFRIPERRGQVRVIGLVRDQITTEALVMEGTIRSGELVAVPERDLAKLVVVERHRGTGRIGCGLVHGLGLREGALASSVAHDSHNLIAAGIDDTDLLAALTHLVERGGGLAVASGGRVTASLPLPIAGLMSDQPLSETGRAFQSLEEEARRLGARVAHPFGALSFLALPVIPKLRLTDRGLVDVEQGRVIPLYVE